MKSQVDSEVGRLRQVILHRPGREMTRLTPSNKDELLFDDVIWLERAQQEHDAFADALVVEGVEVLYLADLLAETLEIPEARDYVLSETFDERWYGLAANDAMRQYADSLHGHELVDLLVGGITKEELLARVGQIRSAVIAIQDPSFMTLRCLPNHLFTRDTSCWIYDGVSVNSMQMVARQRETVNFEAIYRWHPRFAGQGVRMWSRGLLDGAATIEGGDVEVIGHGAVLIGMSERTTPQGVERLSRRLFAEGAATKVIGLHLPRQRALMHLDTVMTMVDPETFMVYGNLGELSSVVIEPGQHDGCVQVTHHRPEDMFEVLAQTLNVPKVRVLRTPSDRLSAERDQWNDGCNLLTLRPGLVMGYDRNVTANNYLRSEGIEVIEVPGSELGRGRGGPRCMSCPTLRDGI